MKIFLNISKKIPDFLHTKKILWKKVHIIISVKNCQEAKVHVLQESLIAARKDFNNSLEYPKSYWVTLVSPVTSNNTPRLTMYVQSNWWWLLVTLGNSAKWRASVCFMEYLTTYELNAMEIVWSNCFLGLYEDPTWSLVEQRKEATFTCHIMYLVAFWHFCTSLILWARSLLLGVRIS
jgi:hypothetical protein